MKSIISVFTLLGLLVIASCSDELDTNPTDKVTGPAVFKTVESAQSAMNGTYRLLYVAGWGNSATENCGQTAVQLMADLMAEDHLMRSQGQGWFYEDYRLNVHSYYGNKAGRSYSLWNFYYTIISNVNFILASEETLKGDPLLIKNLTGQAYAMRAFAYYYLVQLFQQTYAGNEDAPGVPVYTEPTTTKSVGKSRGKLREVLERINEDLDKAIEMLGTPDKKVQAHVSHVDYYVAQGLKARARLLQRDYAAAAAAAAEALKKPGLSLAGVSSLGGNNSVNVSDVLWGVAIKADQSSGYAGFFSHMDSDGKGLYASLAQQCISSGLYNLIPDTDSRKKAWFRGVLTPEGSGSQVSYCQTKFKMADYTTRTGDYIFMRAEEMVLIKAEAECQMEQYSNARATIKTLGNMRDTGFEARLSSRTDSKSYNQNTNDPLKTLMDEILFQRRVELWGEAGRIFDLQRLKLGYSRVYSGSNHSATIPDKNTQAGSPLFIMPLPQSEIDGNTNISDKDQNPIVS